MYIPAGDFSKNMNAIYVFTIFGGDIRPALFSYVYVAMVDMQPFHPFGTLKKVASWNHFDQNKVNKIIYNWYCNVIALPKKDFPEEQSFPTTLNDFFITELQKNG